ncbi:MAG TPA: thiamine diphosphokinase [Candidatus Avacidaminococcus intestinavium]|uniref:Thiamine diphosphokinase n=1 Tax=Candidatus Avacidaminococcus intestinavium TaxID=2840684 RepID=A0A9D1MRK9_9FIRM|nr:thiamine diphosphokinase [Candidatus Avacidaminococcus intestinavium]
MDKSFVQFSQMSLLINSTKVKKFFVIAGGRKPDAKWLKQATNYEEIWCADAGLDYCLDLKKKPKRVYGDFDSCSSSLQELLQEGTIAVHAFARKKDNTDLQLLLNDIPHNSQVIITGVWGGRFDHLYANIYSLAASKKEKNLNVILADHKEIMTMLLPGEEIACDFKQQPVAISLLPLAETNNVSISGVKWPLENKILLQDNPYAISNEMDSSKVNISVHTGLIGCYFNFIE